MNTPLLQHVLASTFDWTWKTSLAATILIALVLLAQLAFAKVLSPRWRYGLGLLILLRLLLPMAPASSLSIFNLGNHRTEHAEIEAPTRTVQPLLAQHPVLEIPVIPVAMTALPSKPVALPHSRKINPLEMAMWAWLTGFAAMLAMVAWQQWRFLRRLGRWEVVREPRVLEMLEGCRAQLGVRRSVAVLAATGLNTPALFGIIRPRLLLPAEMLERLDDRELRHVMLHELVHLRRGDLLVNWAMILLRAMHWFNPAVWFGFRRLRAEQELACDAAVMAQLAADERRDYGRTLLKLLDDFSPGALCPGYVPFITSKQIIKRRIKMISNFKPAGRLAAGISIVLLAGLGSMTFTRADEPGDSPDQRTTGQPRSADQARSATIENSDGTVTVTLSKDGIAKVGSNVTLHAPVALTLNKNGIMEMSAAQMQVETPTAPDYQYNKFVAVARPPVVLITIGKDGAIRIGKDSQPVDPSNVERELKAALDGLQNPVVELHTDGDASVPAEQFDSILDALRQANVPVIKFTTSKSVDGTHIKTAIKVGRGPNSFSMAEVMSPTHIRAQTDAAGAATDRAMAQAQAEIQRAQARVDRQQAAMDRAYARADAMQPNPSFSSQVGGANEFRQANELIAENIRMTREKLNDLQNLKATYASDAAEHSSESREMTSKLNDMLVEAQAQRESKSALLRQLEQMNHAEQRQALPTTVPDATLDKLMQDELAAETKLTMMTETMGPQEPAVKATKMQIDKLNAQVDSRVKGILDGLRAQVHAADDTIENLQKEINAKSQRQSATTDLASQIAQTENELRDLKSQLAGLRDYQKGTVTATPLEPVPPAEPAESAPPVPPAPPAR